MPGNNTSEKLDLLDMVGSRSGCEQEECVCEGVWVLGVPLCLCFHALDTHSFIRRQEAKRAGESVGDEFFRGLDEEKQGYVKAGGKL